MKADTNVPTDRGETLTLMEPMRLSEGSRHRGDLTDAENYHAARSRPWSTRATARPAV